MTRLGKLWTGAVAYVSLGVGAGLSVAGNLADTYRIRGSAVDNVDLVLAVGPPVATLLVAEMFVSPWPRRWSIQAVRWVTTIIVGLLAAVVSWIHLSDLLASRGQHASVAILWPLAIDGLAIMAMAKILSTRGHVTTAPVATGQPDLATDIDPGWTPAMKRDHALATEPGDVASAVDRVLVTWPDPVATQPLSLDGQRLATEVDTFLATVDTHVARPTARPARTSAALMDQVYELYRSWNPDALSAAEVDTLMAAHFEVSARTARRWRNAALGGPTSGAPVT